MRGREGGREGGGGEGGREGGQTHTKLTNLEKQSKELGSSENWFLFRRSHLKLDISLTFSSSCPS